MLKGIISTWISLGIVWSLIFALPPPMWIAVSITLWVTLGLILLTIIVDTFEVKVGYRNERK